MPLDNHPGSRERREERGGEMGSGGCLVIYGSHSKVGNGKGRKRGVKRARGRRRGGEFLVNSQKLLACFLAVIGAGQQKLLLFLMRFGNWLPQGLLFSAWFFRSLMSAGCGDKI
jgi:hypothetical protein